jgi:hypothetical protein
MDQFNRKTKEPFIFSPKPMRLSVEVIKCTVSNPFDEVNSLQRSLSYQDEEALDSELSSILNATIFPLSKSLPSPLFSRYSERPPTRHKVNPIIYDENFLKFDSSSTASDEM